MQSSQQCLKCDPIICWQDQHTVWMPQAAAPTKRAAPHAALSAVHTQPQLVAFKHQKGGLQGQGILSGCRLQALKAYQPVQHSC